MLAEPNQNYSMNLALFLSAAFWGLYWLPLRTLTENGILGYWGIFYLNIFPLIILVPFCILNLKSLKNIFLPSVFSAMLIGIAFTFYSVALLETTVVRATLLFYLTPIWSTLIGNFWLGEKITRIRVFTIITAIIGLTLLLNSNGDTSSEVNLGDATGLISGVFWALGTTMLKRWSTIPLIPFSSLVFGTISAITLILAILVFSDPYPNFAALKINFISTATWSVLIFLPCFYVIFKASRILFPGRVGILMMSEAIVAIVSASILLPDETMHLVQWLGAMIILAASLIEISFKKN